MARVQVLALAGRHAYVALRWGERGGGGGGRVAGVDLAAGRMLPGRLAVSRPGPLAVRGGAPAADSPRPHVNWFAREVMRRAGAASDAPCERVLRGGPPASVLPCTGDGVQCARANFVPCTQRGVGHCARAPRRRARGRRAARATTWPPWTSTRCTCGRPRARSSASPCTRPSASRCARGAPGGPLGIPRGSETAGAEPQWTRLILRHLCPMAAICL